MKHWFNNRTALEGYRLARRLAIATVGGTVLLMGTVMIVLPGPAFIVLPLGLAILGIEFAWARRWLKRLRAQIEKQVESRRGSAAAGGVRQPTGNKG
ncbi:MAG TPA: PGPGW domain-containing protein [Gammaproteobacteria bacterium]|nr:PGPGW domain-containing protein [Gammaproteobacteria bacterium]